MNRNFLRIILILMLMHIAVPHFASAQNSESRTSVGQADE